jgi:hypothetical protein
MISLSAIMASPRRIVCAAFAVGMTIGATLPAEAGRQVHGGDVARLLSGRSFRIECMDGTHGRGQISQSGVINVLYRRPQEQREETDRAVMRVRGVEICLAWKQFNGGGDGCYPVSEEAAGRYRLSTGPAWCDISTK